jgi:4a-hydroxytetrahydrobiopterin dehydratase
MRLPEDWTGDETRIAKCFRFGDFAEALAFMVEVGVHCERDNHHPEWKNIYNKVWVELTTHDAGRVTDKDLALAARMEAVYARAARS